MNRAIEPEALLAEAAWLRRLAVRLAGDDEEADDLAQDAVVAGWQKQPEARGSLRPWLGKVVRDGVKMLRRGRGRRAAREGAVAAASVREPDELLAEARLHQALVTAVLALDEPYRRTILARFVDGLSAVELAQRDGVAAATVRGRQAEALRRLRVALDAHAPRRTWAAMIGATVVRPASWFARGALIAAVVAVAMIALAVWWFGRGGGGGVGGGGSLAIDRRARDAMGDARPRAGRSDGDGALATWTAAGPTTRRIAGRVIDEADRPVAGADVVLDATIAGVGGEAGIQRVRTDADGRFALAPRWHQPSVLTASASAYAAVSVVVDPRGRTGADPDDLLLRLPSCAHRLIGTVRDAGGGGIAGARVRRRPDQMPGRAGAEVIADADGRWSLCMPAGAAWIEVGADGYEHMLHEVTVRGEQLLDVALVPEATVRGVVRDAASGAPIAGAQVTVWPALRRAGVSSERGTLTDADGNFAIDGLAAGEFELTTWAAGYVRGTRPDVWVMAATDAGPIELTLTAGATVRGVVMAGGAPVAGAELWLEQRRVTMNINSDSTITDAAGGFAITRAPIAAGLVPHVRGWSVRTPTTIDTGATTPALVFEVEPRASLRGTVVRGGTPVADAEIVVNGPSGRTSRRSDGRGAFVIEGLVPGPHRVVASSLAVGAVTTTPLAVTLPSAAPVTLVLDGGGAIVGRVVDGEDAPVVGVVVTAQELGSDAPGSGPTAVDGSFVVDALAGGRYRLRVDAYRGAPTPLAWVGPPPSVIEIAGGDARVGPLVLRVARDADTVAGRVVDADGAPVADAFVRLGPAWGLGRGVPTTRTTVDGAFTLPTLGPGPFVLDAGLGGGPSAVARGVRPGQRDLQLTLVVPGSLRGTFAGDGAGVALWRPGGFGTAAVASSMRRTDVVDGRFGFDGLAPGTWHATARTPSGVVATTAVEIRAGEVTTLALTAAGTRVLTGRAIAFETGAPVVGVTCAAASAVGDVRPAPSSSARGAASTDARGAFRLDAPVGPAMVVCRGGSGWSTGATVVDANRDAVVTLVRKPNRAPGALGCWFDPERSSAVVSLLVDGAAPPGLAIGDRVVAVDGADVTHLYVDAIYWLIAGRPDGPVSITIERAGVRRDITIDVAR